MNLEIINLWNNYILYIFIGIIIGSILNIKEWINFIIKKIRNIQLVKQKDPIDDFFKLNLGESK